jgi:hypothetical protein
MTTATPPEWRCNYCHHINQTGPHVNTHPDGAETWRLICGRCLMPHPILHITAKGVRLRSRAADTASPTKRAKLLDQYRAEVTRL